MKNLKFIIAVFAITLLSAFSVSPEDSKSETTNDKISKKIVSLLGEEFISNHQHKETISVSFVLNENDEMVILKVKSKKDFINKIVKDKLDYQTLNVKEAISGEIYNIPLKVKKS